MRLFQVLPSRIIQFLSKSYINISKGETNQILINLEQKVEFRLILKPIISFNCNFLLLYFSNNCFVKVKLRLIDHEEKLMYVQSVIICSTFSLPSFFGRLEKSRKENKIVIQNCIFFIALQGGPKKVYDVI